MELKQLRQFLAAAETESFTRGAQRAFVSQPALSAAIAKLEAELGARLFARDKRRVALTPEGRLLLRSARAVVDECGRIKGELRKLRAEARVRVGVINTLSVDLLARLLEQFRAESPDVFLEVTDGSPPEIGRLAETSGVDLAFAAAALPETGAAPAMDVALFTEPYVLVAPPGHRFKGRKAIAVEELDGEPFVARTHCEYRQILATILKQAGVRPRIACRTDQDERALALVRSGLGIAVVPEHCGARGVLKLAFADRHFSRTVGLRWRPERRSPAADRFVEFCRTADWR